MRTVVDANVFMALATREAREEAMRGQASMCRRAA